MADNEDQIDDDVEEEKGLSYSLLDEQDLQREETDLKREFSEKYPKPRNSTTRRARFGHSVVGLHHSLHDTKQGVESHVQERHVPVFHTFLIKEIKDSDTGPQVVGTFVQRVFGIPPPKEKDPDKKPYFQYRFNECAAMNELVDLRKTEYESAYFSKYQGSESDLPLPQDVPGGEDIITKDGPNKSEGSKVTFGESELDVNAGRKVDVSRHTFQIKAPLNLYEEFDGFPFTVTRANVDVELSSREDYRDKNLRLRPNFLLHCTDRRNNVCIQEIHDKKKKFGKKKRRKVTLLAGLKTLFARLKVQPDSSNTTESSDSKQKSQTDPKKVEEKLKLKLDGMEKFKFVSPYPEIAYHYDSKKKYCPRFSVTFWLVEEGMPKFIRIILPMVLICAMNTINVVNDYLAWRDGTDESTTDGVDRYLNNAATLALTAVFILPEIAICRNNLNIISWNDAYVLLVFIALTLSSLPPRLIGFPHLGFVGMAMFWVSFFIPIVNLVLYGILIREIQEDRQDVVENRMEEPNEQQTGQGAGHPFLKDGNYKEWKAKAPAVIDESCMFVGDIVEMAENGKEVTEDWPDEEVPIEYEGNEYTVSRASEKTLLVSY